MAIIRDIMSGKLVSVTPSTTVAEAATSMAERRVGSALVFDGPLVPVTEGDQVIGVVSIRDLSRATAEG